MRGGRDDLLAAGATQEDRRRDAREKAPFADPRDQ